MAGVMEPSIPTKRFAEIVTQRTVERFLMRLFLRDTSLRAICIVSPFISSLADARYSLRRLREKVELEQVPTYVVTREPSDDYQAEAMCELLGSPWIELRYNAYVHAKLYVACARHDAESFALFGSGNLTGRSIESNIELAMLVYSHGPGREILRDLHYWASVRVRTMRESRLIQGIKAQRR